MDYAIEGAYRSGPTSGLIATVAAGDATNGHLWAARFGLTAAQLLTDRRRVAVIQRLRVRAFTISGYTAAQEVRLSLFKLTGFTALHTAGTAVVAERKFVACPATPLLTQRIAAAVQLTAGTQVLGADPIAAGAYAELAAAPTVAKGSIELFLSTEDLIQHPIELSADEGLLVRNEVLQGAAGTMRLVVEMDWAELQRYPVGTYNIAKSVI